jgi:hypothetical protein
MKEIDYSELQKFAEAYKAAKDKPCPSCGHCPTCGRSAAPYWPNVTPWYPRPYWHDPYITWTCDTKTVSSGNATFGSTLRLNPDA